MRFERTRGDPTALAGPRLNHSATGAVQAEARCKGRETSREVESEGFDPPTSRKF